MVAKANTAPKRFIKEFRFDEMMSYEVGQTVSVDSFVAGEVVDVTGTSKGKGYQGVIKRHGQHRGPMAHGNWPVVPKMPVMQSGLEVKGYSCQMQMH